MQPETLRFSAEMLIPAEKRTRKLLDWLSSYDVRAALQQAQRKRFNGTADWLFKTPEFERWFSSAGQHMLWCSGKRR